MVFVKIWVWIWFKPDAVMSFISVTWGGMSVIILFLWYIVAIDSFQNILNKVMWQGDCWSPPFHSLSLIFSVFCCRLSWNIFLDINKSNMVLERYLDKISVGRVWTYPCFLWFVFYFSCLFTFFCILFLSGFSVLD